MKIVNKGRKWNCFRRWDRSEKYCISYYSVRTSQKSKLVKQFFTLPTPYSSCLLSSNYFIENHKLFLSIIEALNFSMQLKVKINH